MTWLDDIGATEIKKDGVSVGVRRTLDLTGAGVTATDNPATGTLTLNIPATGGGGGGVTSVADHAALRVATPTDGLAYSVLSPPEDWVYSSTTGSGVPDDDESTIKLTATSLGANGRFYRKGSTSPATIAALRLSASGKQKRTRVLCYQSLRDQGGGEFIWRTVDGSNPLPADDGGVNILATGVTTGWWQRQYAGPIHAEWYGIFCDSDDAKATTNRTRFNAMILANLTNAHFVFGNKSGGYMAVDYDASTPSNPRCLILDNLTGATISGQGRSTIIKFVGATPPNTSTYPLATLAMMRGDFIQDCVLENFKLECNSKAHLGLWLKNGCQYNDIYNVTAQNATGVGIQLGQGDGNVSTITDGNSLYHCNTGFCGNGADPGTGRGGMRITDGNTNNTTIAECVVGICGPANPIGGGPGTSLTDGFGIEIDHFPRSTVISNCQMYINGKRQIYVRKELAQGVSIRDCTWELYGESIVEVEGGGGGTHASGNIILDNCGNSYSFRVEHSLSFTFNAGTDIFTTSAAHGYSVGDTVTMASLISAGGALPFGYDATTLYTVRAASLTSTTFTLSSAATAPAAVNGTTNGTGTNYVRKHYRIINDQSPCTLTLRNCRFDGPSMQRDAANNPIPSVDSAAIAPIYKSMTSSTQGANLLEIEGETAFYAGAYPYTGGTSQKRGLVAKGTFSGLQVLDSIKLYEIILGNITPASGDLVLVQQVPSREVNTSTPEALINARAITPASVATTGAMSAATSISSATATHTGEIVAATSVSRMRLANTGTGLYDGIWVNVASGSETLANACFISNGGEAILNGPSTAASIRIANAAMFSCTATTMSVFGNPPIARPGAYTLTYATNTRTLSAYTTDPENVAYTGAADSEAKLADLNALRVAYENLRASHDNLISFVRQLAADFGAGGAGVAGYGWLQ